ncbi:hypothetical protein KSP35_20595 [Aquihabitans sp. G128]|uniref:hypothetical protein n=1 Tax=Aquihabitans sp. G128 TaxID=2849779 RepID=UPI001C212D52|nr:hypothetical protein [Aquihabitans sp. G128]QXC60692.1 hypothetical protein KSP35_20595 [Aquihabitans sp. G128]
MLLVTCSQGASPDAEPAAGTTTKRTSATDLAARRACSLGAFPVVGDLMERAELSVRSVAGIVSLRIGLPLGDDPRTGGSVSDPWVTIDVSRAAADAHDAAESRRSGVPIDLGDLASETADAAGDRHPRPVSFEVAGEVVEGTYRQEVRPREGGGEDRIARIDWVRPGLALNAMSWNVELGLLVSILAHHRLVDGEDFARFQQAHGLEPICP